MKAVLGSILLGASMARAANHIITLGDSGQLTFSPNEVTAAVNDTLEFVFASGNHTVAQSTFASPCQPIANGIWSGFVPVDTSTSSSNTSASSDSSSSSGSKKKRASSLPAFVVTVANDSTPMWFYCAQGHHCQAGMVMGVNVVSGSSKTVAAFASAAASVQSNTPYDLSNVEGGTLTTTGSTSSSSGNSTTTSTTSASSTTSTATATSKSGASAVSASVFTVAVLAGVGCLLAMF